MNESGITNAQKYMKDEEYSLFTGMGLEKENKWHGVGGGGPKKSSK